MALAVQGPEAQAESAMPEVLVLLPDVQALLYGPEAAALHLVVVSSREEAEAGQGQPVQVAARLPILPEQQALEAGG